MAADTRFDEAWKEISEAVVAFVEELHELEARLHRLEVAAVRADRQRTDARAAARRPETCYSGVNLATTGSSPDASFNVYSTPSSRSMSIKTEVPAGIVCIAPWN